jgi:hypothetical protein
MAANKAMERLGEQVKRGHEHADTSTYGYVQGGWGERGKEVMGAERQEKRTREEEIHCLRRRR